MNNCVAGSLGHNFSFDQLPDLLSQQRGLSQLLCVGKSRTTAFLSMVCWAARLLLPSRRTITKRRAAVGTNLGIQLDGAVAIGTQPFGLHRIHPSLEQDCKRRVANLRTPCLARRAISFAEPRLFAVAGEVTVSSSPGSYWPHPPHHGSSWDRQTVVAPGSAILVDYGFEQHSPPTSTHVA